MKRSLWFGLAAAALLVAALVLSLARSPEKPPETATNQPAPTVSAPAAQPAGEGTGPSPDSATVAAAAAPTTGAGETDESPDPAALATATQPVDPSADSAASEPATPPASGAAATAPQSASSSAVSAAAPPTAPASSGTVATSTATTQAAVAPSGSTTGSDSVTPPLAQSTTTSESAPAASALSAPAAAGQPPSAAAADMPAAASTVPAAPAASQAVGSSGSSSPSTVAPATDASPAVNQQAAVPPATTEAPPAEPETGQPSFDVVRVDPAGTLVIAGRADPDSDVTVTSNGKIIGTATADANGEWVILPEEPMPAGNHQLALSAESPDGRDRDADQLVMLVVPEKGKNVAGQPAEKTGGSLALLVPKDDTGGAVVLQQPEPATTVASQLRAPEQGSSGISSGALGLDVVDYDDRGEVVVGGRGTPGATVQLYLDNKPIGTTTVDGGGRWQLTPAEPVAPRLHTLRVDQVGQDGRVAARVESPFLRAERVELPADQAFIVQPGNSLWRIARRTYGEGLRYSVIYDANRLQIRNPDLIYPGQVFAIPPQTQTN